MRTYLSCSLLPKFLYNHCYDMWLSSCLSLNCVFNTHNETLSSYSNELHFLSSNSSKERILVSLCLIVSKKFSDVFKIHDATKTKVIIICHRSLKLVLKSNMKKTYLDIFMFFVVNSFEKGKNKFSCKIIIMSKQNKFSVDATKLY